MKVLFIESGVFGGGASESLKVLIQNFPSNFSPFVFFIYKNHRCSEFNSEGIKSSLFPLNLSNKLYRFTDKITAFLVTKSHRIHPALSLLIYTLFNLPNIIFLYFYIRINSFDLIYTNNNAYRDFWVHFSAFLANTNIVSHLRSFHGNAFNGYFCYLSSLFVDHYIAYSDSIASYWQDKLSLNAKISVIYNALDIDTLSSEPSSLEPLSIDSPCVGLIGHVKSFRGHIYLFKALEILKLKYGYDVNLFVVGTIVDTKYYRQLSNYLSRSSIKDNVQFLGHRSDSAYIIKNIDALILPYTIEPFGRVLLESWFYLTPVICSNLGHIDKIVTHDHDALLFPLEDLDSLSECIHNVLNSPPLSKRLVSNGYETLHSRFLPQQYASSISNILNSLISKS